MLRAIASRIWGRSLRRRLAIGVALVHLVFMTLFVFHLVQRQRQFLLHSAEDRVIAEAGMLARSSTHLVVTNDVAGLAEIVSSLATDPGIRYALVADLRGRVLADSRSSASGQFLQDETSLAVLGGRREARIVSSGPTLVTAVAPVEVSGRALGWIWIARDRAAEAAHLRHVVRSGLLYTFAAILVGTAFAIALSRAATRQLRLLLSGTNRVAAHRLEEPVPVTTSSEVGEVSMAFNDMMRKLGECADERERLLAELRAAVRARDDFISIASHELKTPLTALELQVGSSRRLLERRRPDEPVPPDVVEAKLAIIGRQAERLGDLVENLLDVSRITSDRMQLAIEPCDLREIVRSVVARCRAIILQSGSAVTVDAGDVSGRWDRRRIEAVFENLLSNALKYGEGKPIEISTRGEHGLARLVVKDHGIGISEEAQSRIFERFERAVSSKHYGGLGLGLWIARQIVEAHRGRISVASGAGEGATFTIELPLDAAAPGELAEGVAGDA